MPALYRKYRPQKFNEVVGQNHIKITLEHEIDSGKITHAYLFCGPRAVGKTTVARVLAKAINCTSRKEGQHEPCNKCEACKEITAQKSLDIIEIDAASHTGVDNVRENIIAASRVTPSKEKHKVFIIDEIHMLSVSAFNALLKVLEEPPENVVFILCTTEVHKIPATIISRCERFDFRRISIVEVTKRLQDISKKEEIEIEKKILEAIARHSEGHMRDAESLLGQVVAIGGKKITSEEADLVIPRSDLEKVLELIEMLSKKDAGLSIGLVNRLIDEGVDLKRFLVDLVEVLRKIMLAKISPGLSEKLGLEFGESIEVKINEISNGLDLNQVLVFIDKFIQAKNDMKNSFIVQLPIEIVIAELCSHTSPQVEKKVTPSMGTANANIQTSQNSQISQSRIKPNITNENIDIKINEILAKWNEVLAKIKKHNHSLSFILRVCQPREIKSNQLCLAFKYKFHRDRINNVNIKRLVEKVLHEVYDSRLEIEAVIDESMEVANGNGNIVEQKKATPESEVKTNTSKNSAQGKDDNQMIDNLLKTFGGKVVK